MMPAEGVARRPSACRARATRQALIRAARCHRRASRRNSPARSSAAETLAARSATDSPSPADREWHIAQTDLAQTVDLLEYLFASLLEFKMTAMQTTLFRSVLRSLVSAFPNPTLETFRDLLTNGYESYREHIEKLPPDLKDFFYKDFNEKGYADRRREVLQRLRLLLDNDTMRAMLTATVTRFRIGEAMDTGKIVIINNSKARLGAQGAEFFGRFFIAQVLAAAQQRSSRQRGDKPPVYVYIDECQNVNRRDE